MDILIFMLELSVAKVAKCMFRKNNKFTLVFDLSGAEVADVTGFSEVRGGLIIYMLVLSVAKLAKCVT